MSNWMAVLWPPSLPKGQDIKRILPGHVIDQPREEVPHRIRFSIGQPKNTNQPLQLLSKAACFTRPLPLSKPRDAKKRGKKKRSATCPRKNKAHKKSAAWSREFPTASPSRSSGQAKAPRRRCAGPPPCSGCPGGTWPTESAPPGGSLVARGWPRVAATDGGHPSWVDSGD